MEIFADNILMLAVDFRRNSDAEENPEINQIYEGPAAQGLRIDEDLAKEENA